MTSRRFTLALVLAFALSAPARAEETEVELPRDEASLALDSPDTPTTDAAEQLEENDLEQQIERDTSNESEVPAIDEDTFAAREGNDQIKLLKYHRQLISDRDRTRASGREEPPHRFHFGLGGNVLTFGGAGGGADFQVALSDHFTLGALLYTFGFLSAANVNGTIFVGNVSALGFGAAFNYYSRKPYEGIWVQLGGGLDSFRVGSLSGDTISNDAPIFFTIGWRFINESNNLTFGFGAGGRLYPFATEPSWTLTAKFEIGLAWNVFPH